MILVSSWHETQHVVRQIGGNPLEVHHLCPLAIQYADPDTTGFHECHQMHRLPLFVSRISLGDVLA